MNLKHVHDWARQQRKAGAADIIGMVADFVLLAMESPGLPADRLASIQRRIQPIDDAGTCLPVSRDDVQALVTEVVRCHAELCDVASPVYVTTAEAPVEIVTDIPVVTGDVE